MNNASTMIMLITLFVLMVGCSHDHHNEGHHDEGHHHGDTSQHEHAEDELINESKNTHQDISN